MSAPGAKDGRQAADAPEAPSTIGGRVPRLHWALLAAVVALSAIVVRMAFNPLPHTGGDNAGYVALAHGLVTEGTYTDVFDPERLPHTKYPPAFPALLALLIALGARTWVALKTTAAVATVAAVGLTYLWAERTLSPLGAFVVALLTAMSVGVVYYSQWVLSDPVFFALTVGSLFALARAARRDRWDPPAGSTGVGAGSDTPSEGGGTGGRGSPGLPPIHLGWLAVGVLGAALAYFTRSAGLPLVVAVLGWLTLRRAWRPLAASGLALGVPMLAWWLRGRSGGVAQYGSEFWMVNPYDPSLGTIGVGGLVGRFFENLVGYTTRHLPMGVVGADAPAVSLIGVALVLAAVVGWVLSLRRRPDPAELFLPLYAGVILLWPTVWSGDRFALPLLPLVFVYGALALRASTKRLPASVGPIVAAVAALVLLVPAADDWRRSVAAASACPPEVREESVWACYGPRVENFMAAASWTGDGLPPGSAVLSRKPRHFYLQSGVPSRAFAFFERADAHLELADELGARYILLDQWDGFAARYVGAAVRERPAAFCFVRGFGRLESGGAQLLGVLPPEARATGAEDGGRVTVRRCPPDYAVEESPTEPTYSSSGRIPLLDALDS